MESWTAGGLPDSPRRATILHAIAAHDDGWLELDAAPIVGESGAIDDFMTLPAALRQAVWPRGVLRLAGDPWAAALVAQHAVWIFSRFRDDPDWASFFDQMTRLRDTFVARSGLSLAELEHDYDFVRLGDLVSLTFCNAWTDQQDHAGCVVTCDGSTVVVRPDPFGARAIPIEIRGVRMPNRRYRDAADAAEAWRAGPPVSIAGRVVGDSAA